MLSHEKVESSSLIILPPHVSFVYCVKRKAYFNSVNLSAMLKSSKLFTGLICVLCFYKEASSYEAVSFGDIGDLLGSRNIVVTCMWTNPGMYRYIYPCRYWGVKAHHFIFV